MFPFSKKQDLKGLPNQPAVVPTPPPQYRDKQFLEPFTISLKGEKPAEDMSLPDIPSPDPKAMPPVDTTFFSARTQNSERISADILDRKPEAKPMPEIPIFIPKPQQVPEMPAFPVDEAKTAMSLPRIDASNAINATARVPDMDIQNTDNTDDAQNTSTSAEMLVIPKADEPSRGGPVMAETRSTSTSLRPDNLMRDSLRPDIQIRPPEAKPLPGMNEDFSLPDFEDVVDEVHRIAPMKKESAHADLFVRAYDYLRLMSGKKQMTTTVALMYKQTDTLFSIQKDQDVVFEQWYGNLDRCQEKLMEIDTKLFMVRS